MKGSSFSARREKEYFAFLVIRFLRAYGGFEEIYREFRAIEEREPGREPSFAGAGLFARVRDLEEQLVFDVKEKAHALFRRERTLLSRASTDGLREETRGMFSALRQSLVNRSLDAYIGTGFHMFMILRESLYQLECYAPQYAQEMEQVERIDELTRRVGYELDEEERHELGHIRQVAALCQGIASDTRELASIALERCRSLFRETAEVIRHSIEDSQDNEVLVLNLLRETDLVDAVFGPGAGEEILAHMFRSSGSVGRSGRDKAMAYARAHCGNVEGL